MGRDSWRHRQAEEERLKRKRINPIWRGVGCLLILLLGLLGYVFSGWFIGKGFVYFPPALRRPSFAPWLPQDMVIQLVVALLFMIFSYTLLTAVYAVLFPIRPGELDAPPMKRGDKERWG